jgi:ferredoxin
MMEYQPSPYGEPSDLESMHVASATETTGAIPTPPVSDGAGKSYAQVSGMPDVNAADGLPVYAYVDPDTCIGCGVCESMCPDVFAMGEDSLAHAIAQPVPPELAAEAESARFACPVSAIDVRSQGEC